jgi:GTPase Era involved in 16S rRNA processing
MEPTKINIAILGPVSAGKSTFMNALFVKQFSDMKIKRTTMTPQVYCETDNLKLSLEDIKKIKEKNKEINNELIRKTENNEEIKYKEISQTIEYNVPRVYNLHNLPNNVFLRVYDIPGLNDARTQELYFKYLDRHFHEWDIIIMVVDINSAMNTDGEVRILKKIVNKCKRNLDSYNIQNKLFILANKVDDLEHDPEWGLRIADDEYVEMYEQIKKQVKDVVDKTYPELEYNVMPISAEDAFIYRMYGVNPNVELEDKHINKFGHNEFGKSKWNRFSMEEKLVKIKNIMSGLDINDNLQLTGFNYFQQKLSEALSPSNQYTFIMNHIIYDCETFLEDYKNNYNQLCKGSWYRSARHIKYNNNTLECELADGKGNWIKSKLEFKYDNIYINKFGKFISAPIKQKCFYELFLEQYNKILEVNKIYNLDSGLELFYECLTEFVELHSKVHLATEEQLTNTKEEDLEHLEWAQLHCKKWQDKFGPDFALIGYYDVKITNALNKYYSSNIEEQQKPVSTLLSRFMKLVKNGFKITKELVSKLFTNNDMLNKKPEEIINIIKDLKSKKLINNQQEQEMLSKLLHKIYYKISKNENLGYINKDNIPEYVYFADLFWTRNNLFLKEDREVFYDLGFRAKQNLCLRINPNNKDKFTRIDIFNPEVSLEAYYVSLF